MGKEADVFVSMLTDHSHYQPNHAWTSCDTFNTKTHGLYNLALQTSHGKTIPRG